MTALSVLCALVCAAANGAVSVLQRLAALDRPTAAAGAGAGASASRRWAWLLHSKAWWAGSAALGLASVAQAAALGLGSLSLVQPLLTSELLFALLIGRLVFRRDPGSRTWAAFTALAGGLALFLAATDPRPGGGAAPSGRWALVGLVVTAVVVALVGLVALCAANRRTSGASRAVLLGCATATGFAMTAALVKEVLTRVGASGFWQLWADWPPYALAVAGGSSFAMLQVTLRAGSLRASQPALTLVDALVSVALGRLLFAEQLYLGVRVVPALAGVALMVAGVVGLARSRALATAWDTRDARRR